MMKLVITPSGEKKRSLYSKFASKRAPVQRWKVISIPKFIKF